jgi:NTP pyrophosphatase (non-canonical NTP hydrolase)
MKNIFEKAIEKWGEDNQVLKIQEECLELALVINNLSCPTKSRAKSYRNFIDECADVCIMMKQAELIIGKDVLNRAVLEKLVKLQKHIDKK